MGRNILKSVCMVAAMAMAAQSQTLLPLARTAGADPGLGIPACEEGPGWYSLYDGTDSTMIKYWFNASPQNHGINSRWWIENGILNSGQGPNGGGGCIFTKHQYVNVEAKVLIKPHFGNDGGLFFRSNSVGRAYQVVIDYKAGKSVAGIYLERISGPDHKSLYFGGSPSVITTNANWLMNGKDGRPLMGPADWTTKIWKLNDFNWIGGKIYNDEVPWMDTFINGYPIVHYKNPANIAATVSPQMGHIALQIHYGTGSWALNSVNQYKGVLVRELQKSGAPLASYPDWTAACGTVGVKPSAPSYLPPSVAWKLDAGKTLRIDGTSPEDYTLTLTDVNGKSVFRARGSSGYFGHSVKIRKPGLHLMTLRTPRHVQTYRLFQPNG